MGSQTAPKSLLFRQMMVFERFNVDKKSRSSGKSGEARSKTHKIRSASSKSSRLFPTPIASTSSAEEHKPAVSKRRNKIPKNWQGSSMTSLVVPALWCTITLSWTKRALRRLDLPTLGRPAKTVFTPSL